MTLRNDGIYLLPDGREMIARQTEGLSYELFDPCSGPASAPVYFVGPGGEITSWGRPVAWRANDLRFTGRRATGSLNRLDLSHIEFA